MKTFKPFTLFPGVLALWPAAVPAQTFSTLHNFASGDGVNPTAGLVLSGTTLYGTTYNGGQIILPGLPITIVNTTGTVFRVSTDGTGFATLHNFMQTGPPDPYGGNSFTNFTAFDGVQPHGGLALSGGALYGTTQYGGTNGVGMMFSVDANGTRYFNLYDFTNVVGGANPVSGLVVSSNTFYGTLQGGFGSVFRVDIDPVIIPQHPIPPSFTTLHPFGYYVDGAYPIGGLVLSGNTLYGTTAGDQYGGSTVFKVNTDGTGFATLYTFTNGVDGALPLGGLILSSNTLYGTANVGGSAGDGTVFKVNTDGKEFATLYSFTNGTDGANPAAGLVLSGNTLYGTAEYGGSAGNGTVFKVNTDGTGFATLHSFSATNFTVGGVGTNSDGANPVGSLVLSGNVLYGTAEYGGTNGFGTVFAMDMTIPLTLGIQMAGDSVVLSWTNSPVTLQAAPLLDGGFTNVPNATSPYTYPITGPQMFFRLQPN